MFHSRLISFFFFNDTPPTEIYTLSLHDALPICAAGDRARRLTSRSDASLRSSSQRTSATSHLCGGRSFGRSEEHTSELQSLRHLVCRLLLEKKKKIKKKSRHAEQYNIKHMKSSS